MGMILPVESSRSTRTARFDFILKSPPAAVLLKKAAGDREGRRAGSGSEVAGKVTRAQDLEEIAEIKKNDLNARDVDHACRIIAGTARSMRDRGRGASPMVTRSKRYEKASTQVDREPAPTRRPRRSTC